ncbi:hypothetical protein BBJ28_00003874 [Nothophytophthora sp. Chile5]|nr:hypothetical protein BBJ28_00003874 [Nothophytophthora sp. Chile5]
MVDVPRYAQSATNCRYCHTSRDAVAYFEVPLACASILVFLVIGVFLTSKAVALLRFSGDENDAFDFPREWEASLESSLSARLLRGAWSGPTQKGLPWKPAKRHLMENMLITLVVLLELVQWVQLTALSFLPVVPWPASSRGMAKLLRLPLLYPLWSHLEASHFPTTMLYLALGFVPGVLIVACVLGAKRFPLFKPQPKSSPAEDLCTVMLRLYSEWLVLPIMIGLLLPLECVFIGYSKDEASDMVLPTMDASCFSLLQGAQIAAGVCMLLVFWFVNGLRMFGAILSTWSSVVALVATIVDDPGVTTVYEQAWYLGAIAISTISLSSLLLYHTEEFWFRLMTTVKSESSKASSALGPTSSTAAMKDGKVTGDAPSDKMQTGKVAAIGFRAGLPSLQPSRRSSTAEKQRSRAKHGQSSRALK